MAAAACENPQGDFWHASLSEGPIRWAGVIAGSPERREVAAPGRSDWRGAHSQSYCKDGGRPQRRCDKSWIDPSNPRLPFCGTLWTARRVLLTGGCAYVARPSLRLENP